MTATPVTRHYTTIMDFLDTLRKDDHDFQTLIVNSLDSFEQRALFGRVCEVMNVPLMDYNKNIGRSYVKAIEFFDDFMIACERLQVQKRMFEIFTARSVKDTFDDPIEGSWLRCDMQLHKRIAPSVFHDSDFVFYMKPKGDIVETADGKK